MFEVQPNEVPGLGEVLKPLFATTPSLVAALAGETPGLAIVDSLSAPTACLLRLQFLGGTYFMGATQPFLDEALQRARRYGEVRLLWEGPEVSALRVPEEASEEWENLTFTDRTPPSGPAPPLPDGCRLEPIDDDLAKRRMWRDFVPLCNPPSDFHNAAMGYALMRGEEILSEAWAPFWGDGSVDTGIVTAEKHRRKGYAVVVCEHLVRAYEGLGWEAVWHTSRDNVGSVGVARRLGFQSEQSCPGYLYPMIGR